MSGVEASPAEAQAIREMAGRLEPDHYLSALLAPRARRDDLIVLAAFLAEIRRVALTVSEPMLGEIRLAWWRDAIAARFTGERSGNPTLDAMLEVAARNKVPFGLIERVIDGAIAELADPVADEAFLERHLDAAYGAAFEIARRILSADEETSPHLAPAATSAGRAYGAVRLALRLPRLIGETAEDGRNGQGAGSATDAAGSPAAILALTGRAQEALGCFRAMIGSESRSARLAYLPVCLVEAYVRALHRAGREGYGRAVEIAPLTRVMRLWLAARLGRF